MIDDNGTSWNVTESGAYLEISNGTETITIYRNIIYTIYKQTIKKIKEK